MELLILLAGAYALFDMFVESERESGRQYDDGSGGGDDGFVTGSTENDELFGGSGNDTLDGGDDNDFLDGGEGDDTLIGGNGDDLFFLAADEGDDIVADFAIGDQLQFTGLPGPPTFSDDGLDTQVPDGTGHIVILQNVIASELTLSGPDANGDFFVDRVIVPETSAVIGGDVGGALTEDSAATLVASGTLTVTDPNPGEAEFVAQSAVSGIYGTFSIVTDGSWTYSADNSQSVIQALNTGDGLLDQFAVATRDGTSQLVTITINGATDFVPATIGGTTTGAVTEDTAATLTTSGTLSITDPNPGEAVFVAQSATAGTYGSFTLNTDGSWNYSADSSQAAIQALNTGDAINDAFGVISADGTSATVTITVNGVTDFVNATIGGATSGTVTEDAAGTLTAAGGLTVTDPNPGEAVFVAQSATAGTYGSFDLASDGSWTYSADNSQAAVQTLTAAQTVTDVFTATTADGTTQGVTITLGGINDVPVALADATSLGEDAAAITINVVANDIDTDAGTLLSIASFDTTGTIGAVALTSATSFSYSPNGKFAYINTGETATDTFTYLVDDGDGGSAMATVTLTINGDDGVIPSIELSDVANGTGGFVIKGVSASNYAGWDVSDAGDVNGDGITDMIVSAPNDDPIGSYSGATIVVFGKGGPTPVELSNVEAGVGCFVINGISAYDEAGRSVSAAGDVNGDGLDDVIIGTEVDDTNGSRSGAAFVVFGKADGTAVELSNVAAGTGGFVINGSSAYDSLGGSVGGGGDINGDGLDDVIVGAHFFRPDGVSFDGAAFVVFGKTDGTALEASDIAGGTGGFAIFGVDDSDYTGYSVDHAGDVNGDGLDDVIVGAQSDDPMGRVQGAALLFLARPIPLPLNWPTLRWAQAVLSSTVSRPMIWLVLLLRVEVTLTGTGWTM